MFLFSQQKKAISPLPTQSQINKEFIPNPEYEKAIIDYEKLINKYPDKKELYYNLGNLNYLSGDSESALQNYKNSLLHSDPNTKADVLYNMGNTFYQMGDLQNSVDFFKEALSLNPNDEDIRYNYELSKQMLEQQPPQKNQDSKEGERQKDQEGQESQEGDENEQDKNPENSEKVDNENEQKQSEDGEENVEEEQEQTQEQDENEKNEEVQKQKKESQIQDEKEKQLGKEEAEAILNALKADANNLKPRKYRAKGLMKLEKDW